MRFCSICNKALVEKYLLTSSYWGCPDEDEHYRQKQTATPPPIPQQSTKELDPSYSDIFINGLRRSIKSKLKYSSHELDMAIEDLMDTIRTERGMLSGPDVFEYEKDLIDFINNATAQDLEMVLRPGHYSAYGVMDDDDNPINWDMD